MKATLWAVYPFSDILVAEMGEEAVVFDTGSGSTHVVDAIAVDVLKRVSRAPVTGQDLLNGIGGRFELPVDAGLEEYLDSLLRTLHRKLLIRPVDA